MIWRIITLCVLIQGGLKAQDPLFYDHFFRLVAFKRFQPQSMNVQEIEEVLDKIIQDDGVHEKRFQLWRILYASPRVRKELGNQISYPTFIRFCEKTTRSIGISSPIHSKEDFVECLRGVFSCDNLQDVRALADNFFQHDPQEIESWIYSKHMVFSQATDFINNFCVAPKKQEKIVISNYRGALINQ